MAETNIEWADAVWNPARGCSRVSDGCRHCYAERTAARFSGKGQPYEGLIKIAARRQIEVDAAGEPTGRARDAKEARWNGEVRFVAKRLADPLKWRKPRRIFVNSMSDLFHEKLTNEQIAAVFGVMSAAPHHTFIVLTKRARRMREWFEWALDGTARSGVYGFYDATFLNHLTSKAGLDWESHPKWLTHCEETEDTSSAWPLSNVILGVSVENRAALERLDDLRACPAVVRLISAEPLLEDLGKFDLSGIGWLIAGCESGPGARSCEVAWLRSLRDQCAHAGVPYFLKQARADELGYSFNEKLPITTGPGSTRKPSSGVGRGIISLPYLDGVQHAAFPEMRR